MDEPETAEERTRKRELATERWKADPWAFVLTDLFTAIALLGSVFLIAQCACQGCIY